VGSRGQRVPLPGAPLLAPNRRAPQLGSVGRFRVKRGIVARTSALAGTRSITPATASPLPAGAGERLPIRATGSPLPGVAALRPLTPAMASSLPGAALTLVSAHLVLTTVPARPAVTGGTARRPVSPSPLDWLARAGSPVPAYLGPTCPGPRAGTAGHRVHLGPFGRRFPARAATGGWLRQAEGQHGLLLTRRAGLLTPTQDRVGTGRLAGPM
jgi:hypothetical protein